MKNLSLIIVLFALVSGSIAQNSSGEWCATDELLKEFHEQNPEMEVAYEQELKRFNKEALNFQINKANHTYTIPVVVHVIHYNGAGNISKAQILDGLRILNEDFQKLNADTSSVRNVFKPYIVDSDIEFRLAKIDPNGNCTEGINRVNHHFSYNKRNDTKTLIGWDPYSYLNVWIVNSIASGSGGGTTLGYAQFPPPTSGLASTYGLVVRSDEWGSIELAQGTDGRTVTHEIGHCLNLYHPFQGGCGSACHATGDFICDTPPQASDHNNSCSFSLNSCSNDASGGVSQLPNPYNSDVPDQLENYMGYATGCQGMFSIQQKSRMYAAINAYTKLDCLVTNYNAIQTGTNDGFVSPACNPIVEVHEGPKFICAGDAVTFNEDSYGGPLSIYTWSFPGGIPSTSSSPNPTVTYNTAGKYDVTLKISNVSGEDSIVLSNYVNVSANNAKYLAFGYIEDFENTSRFNSDWTIVDRSKSSSGVWSLSNFAAYSGTNSVWINNRNGTYNGAIDQLVSPALDMASVSSPTVAMRVAYKRKTSSSDDKLKLFASTDCGKNWINLLSMSPLFYAYDNSTSNGNFIPTSSSQWQLVSIPPQFIPTAIKNSAHVKFMIEMEHGDGNNLFIDDFQINGQPVGINENKKEEWVTLSMFPNPTKDQTNINLWFDEKHNQSTLYVTDLVGKKVEEVFTGDFEKGNFKFILNTSEYESGIYFVTLQTDKGRKTQKLIVR